MLDLQRPGRYVQHGKHGAFVNEIPQGAAVHVEVVDAIQQLARGSNVLKQRREKADHGRLADEPDEEGPAIAAKLHVAVGVKFQVGELGGFPHRVQESLGDFGHPDLRVAYLALDLQPRQRVAVAGIVKRLVLQKALMGHAKDFHQGADGELGQ